MTKAEIEIVRERLAKYYNFVKLQERLPKSQRSPRLPDTKRRVRTMTRWLKETRVR